MTPAHLAYLTAPTPDQIALNIQLPHGVPFPREGFVRLELSRRQLALIVVDGVGMLLAGGDENFLGQQSGETR